MSRPQAVKVPISLAPTIGKCAWYTLGRTPSLTQKVIGPVWKMKCWQTEQVLIFIVIMKAEIGVVL